MGSHDPVILCLVFYVLHKTAAGIFGDSDDVKYVSRFCMVPGAGGIVKFNVGRM